METIPNLDKLSICHIEKICSPGATTWCRVILLNGLNAWKKIFVLEFTQNTSSDGIQCHSMGNHPLPSPVEWKEYCDAYTDLSIVCVALENTQRVTMIYCREPGYHDAVFQGMITKEYGELFKLENP